MADRSMHRRARGAVCPRNATALEWKLRSVGTKICGKQEGSTHRELDVPALELPIPVEDALTDCRILLATFNGLDRCPRSSSCIRPVTQDATEKCVEAHACYLRLPAVEKRACPEPREPMCYSLNPCKPKNCTIKCGNRRKDLYSVVSATTADLASAAIQARTEV
nr:PREDICTED: uncharacterized protein LOC109036338 [Bemisia tabaci]